MNKKLCYPALILILLTLTGCAAVAVGGAAAVGASMIHDRRSSGTVLDDQGIELKTKQRIASDVELQNNSHIEVNSYNNVVLLVGQADNESLKQKAERLAQDVPKVRRIYNEINIAEPSSYGTRTKDAWISTKVKSQLLINKEIDHTRIHVTTEDSVVYLMGIVTPEEDDIATHEARSVKGVTKVIKIFEYI